jgi:hypothetical protein
MAKYPRAKWPTANKTYNKLLDSSEVVRILRFLIHFPPGDEAHETEQAAEYARRPAGSQQSLLLIIRRNYICLPLYGTVK